MALGASLRAALRNVRDGALRHTHVAPHDTEGYGAMLDLVRGLRWRARRTTTSSVPGMQRSRARGISAEFTEYRPYRQGDDLRRVDWKLFARTDRAYLRLSEEQAVTRTAIIMDASRSMAFPETTLAKWRLGCRLAVGLSAVAHAGGDPTGLMIPAAGAVEPRTRRDIVAELIRVLTATRPEHDAPMSPTLLAAARTASRIAIIGDLLDESDDVIATARELVAVGRDVHMIHVVAREEIDPPAGSLVVEDPEHRDVRRPMGGAARAEYLTAFGAWRRATADAWRSTGAAYHVVVTDAEPITQVIRRIVSGVATDVESDVRTAVATGDARA